MKKLLIGLVGILVIGAVAAYFLISNLGTIIVAAVEAYGPQITGTKVTLKEADLSATSGEGALRGLVIGNPQGFGTPQAFRLGEVKLRLDIASITAPTIHIHEIAITAPEIIYELGPQGIDNITLIRRAAEGSAAQSKGAPSSQPQTPQTGGAAKPADSKGGEKKLIIDSVSVRDTKVVAAASLVAGRSVSATLPPIQLRDIGKSKGGVTPAEASAEIMGAISRQVQAEVTKMGIEQLRGVAGPGGVFATPKDAGDMLRKVIGR